MMKYGLLFVTWLVVLSASGQGVAVNHEFDERWQQQLQQLTKRLGWSTPTPKVGDYEVRIWYKHGLVKGAAHGIYIIRKINRNVFLNKYRIQYTEQGSPVVSRYRPKHKLPLAVWDKLLERHLLTLPTLSDILTRYYAGLPRDSTWTEIAPDGTITVKARKSRKRLLFGDGSVEYGFSIFSHEGSRFYVYSAPDLYCRELPTIPELRNAVDILNELSSPCQHDTYKP